MAKSGKLLGMVLMGPSSASVCAFSAIGGGGRPPQRSLANDDGKRGIIIPTRRSPSSAAAAVIVGETTSMRMSSIGHDEPDGSSSSDLGAASDSTKDFSFSWEDVLPSPPDAPEDQLVMSGDIAALFLYSFLDHTLNDAYAAAIQAGDAGTAAAIDPDLATADVLSSQQLPVWFDAAAHAGAGPAGLGGHAVLPSLGYVPYAPAISTAGTSAVVLTTAWLIAGYFSGAFLFRNTLECSTQRALGVAGKTWVVATVLTVGVALASDAWCDCVHTPSLGGLTKADADFLFGSLSVLAMWRYILSSILGYGGSDD